MDQPLINLNLHKFKRFYINKHITNIKLYKFILNGSQVLCPPQKIWKIKNNFLHLLYFKYSQHKLPKFGNAFCNSFLEIFGSQHFELVRRKEQYGFLLLLNNHVFLRSSWSNQDKIPNLFKKHIQCTNACLLSPGINVYCISITSKATTSPSTSPMNIMTKIMWFFIMHIIVHVKNNYTVFCHSVVSKVEWQNMIKFNNVCECKSVRNNHCTTLCFSIVCNVSKQHCVPNKGEIWESFTCSLLIFIQVNGECIA